MGRNIMAGTTDQSTIIRILDSTTFLPETAVEYNTSGIDLWYRREGATKTSIIEAALAALDAAHSDGGIEHIGDGYYRLDLPDAAVAASSTGVAIGGTVTGMVVIGNYHALVAFDPYDGVRLGLTALPNAAADAAGGLAISDAGGLDLDAKLAHTDEITAARLSELDEGTAGKMANQVDIIQTDTTTDIPGTITTMQGNVTSILEDTGTTLDALIKDVPTVAEFEARTLVAADYTIVADLGTVQTADHTASIAAILEDTGTTLPGTLATIAGYIDTEITTIINNIATAQADLDILTGADGATLATAQGNYAPAKAGDEMDLVNAPNATAVTAIQNGLATLTKLLKYTQLLARSDAAIETDNATELTAINADGGSGAGNFSAQTDSVEALRDRGDAAWITATGFMPDTEDGSSFTAIPSETIEGAVTLKQAVQALLAFCAGKASGGGTTTLVFRDQADSKDRITMTVDANGNRSVVSISYD